MEPKSMRNTDGKQACNWQDLAREALADHLTANSICILACNELEQNGCPDFESA